MPAACCCCISQMPAIVRTLERLSQIRAQRLSVYAQRLMHRRFCQQRHRTLSEPIEVLDVGE